MRIQIPSWKRTSLTIILILSILLAGCTTSAGYHDVDFGGRIGIVNGVFMMDGEVNVGVGAAKPYNFTEVQVVLLDEKQDIIATIPVRNLSTNPTHGPITRRINITSEQIPAFVLIRSPDFWTDQTEVQVAAYYRPNGTSDRYVRYEEYVRYSPDQLTPRKDIEDDELPPNRLTGPAPVTAPFSIGELATVDAVYHQTPDTQYLFVANDTESVLLGTRQTGANFYFLGNALYAALPTVVNSQGMVVFTENHPHDLARRKTAVHEIAHSFQIGEADDDCSKRLWRGGEFYSGEDRLDTPPDPTPEAIGPVQRWSVMASGWLGS